MSGIWEKVAVRRLSEEGAPRAFRREDLAEWLAKSAIEPSARTLGRALAEWEVKGLIARPVQGVFLNLTARPIPQPEEAISILRPQAVISLSSILGQAGVLNNPSYWVSAVLPVSAVKGPVDIEMTDGRMLRFAYMRDDYAQMEDEDARQVDTRVAKATPEKALMDWIYLSSSARGAARWPLPALHDLDLDDLDAARLDRLAARMDLVEPLAQLREAIEQAKPRVKVERVRPEGAKPTGAAAHKSRRPG